MSTKDSGIDWQEVTAQIAAVGRELQGERSDRCSEEILRRRAERFRRAEESVSLQRLDLIVFRRHKERYAAALQELEGVREAQKITALPGVSPRIRGVINLRGQIVAIHDLALISEPTAPMPTTAWAVIGAGEEGLIALLADEVEGVMSPQVDAIRPLPLSLQEREGSIRGVLEDGTLVLDFAGLSRDQQFYLAQEQG